MIVILTLCSFSVQMFSFTRKKEIQKKHLILYFQKQRDNLRENKAYRVKYDIEDTELA